ncbi:hypothetical protein WKY82_02030 [Gordonia malaquae]|uniref:hypothetical protein n=1 Tax=Gordonia malaquae TaxID=410332 RepID=UPI0030C79B1D
MGAGGAALVLILILLLVVTVPLGLILLVVAYNTRGDKHSRATAIIGGVLIGSVPVVSVALIVGALIFGAIISDPKTLVVDLRSPATASDLGGDRSGTTFYFTSDNIDLTLPDGSTFRADDVTVDVDVVGSSDTIESVSIRKRAQPWRDTVDTLRDWSHDLDNALRPPTGPDHDWRQTAESGGAIINLQQYPMSTSNKSSLRLIVDLQRANRFNFDTRERR